MAAGNIWGFPYKRAPTLSCEIQESIQYQPIKHLCLFPKYTELKFILYYTLVEGRKQIYLKHTLWKESSTMNYMQTESCITKLFPCPHDNKAISMSPGGDPEKKECFDLVITHSVSLGNLSWSSANYHSQKVFLLPI